MGHTMFDVQSSVEQCSMLSSSRQFVSSTAHVSLPEFAPSVTTSSSQAQAASAAVAAGRDSYRSYYDPAVSSRASSIGGDDVSDAQSVAADASPSFDSLLSPSAFQDILVRLQDVCPLIKLKIKKPWIMTFQKICTN